MKEINSHAIYSVDQLKKEKRDLSQKRNYQSRCKKHFEGDNSHAIYGVVLIKKKEKRDLSQKE
ncbi:MAG: hypothetical protein K9H06_20350 [Melioribacteraceae bacterium]|nr:hypothetical protein [Melioribacteraceae bacterium]MCF8420967.1 hypothetical protein [Melioribacteraceae bacterium]